MKWGIMFVLGASLLSGMVKEEWIVDETKQVQWEKWLQKAHLTTDYVRNVLEKQGNVHLTFGPVAECPSLPNRMNSPSIPEELLWHDEKVSVYSARNPRVSHHLWVVLNRPVSSFTEVLPEEALYLRAKVNQVLHILRHTFALPSAVTAQRNTPQSGQLQGRFTIEILPPRAEYKQVHYIPDKIDSNNHVLFREKFPPLLSSPTASEIALNNTVWKKALAESPLIPEIERDPCEDWTQTQVESKRAGRGLVDYLYQLCLEEGIGVERKIFGQPEEEKPIITQIKQCAFCNPKVIQSQLIYEGERILILYNYKPATPGSSYLLIPKRHLHSTDKLNPEEAKELHQLAVTLVDALQKERGCSDVIMYTQDGPEVGQTVKHCHLHLILQPNPLRYLFFSMNYPEEKCYTRDEMLPHVQDIISKLKN